MFVVDDDPVFNIDYRNFQRKTKKLLHFRVRIRVLPQPSESMGFRLFLGAT